MTGETKGARRRVLKLIFYNLLVFLVLINAIYWAIPIVGAIEQFARYSGLASLSRKIPGGYAGVDTGLLRKHWTETDRNWASYKSYVGWRMQPFKGETITIEGRYRQRRTVNPPTAEKGKVYFFGGSTMWGGVDDASTIPSQFAALTGMHAENFGEHGWVAHQSLVQLMQLLQEGHRPDVVVFYDGANDVLLKCQSGLGPDAHQRERQFAENLGRGVRPYYFAHYWAPLAELARNIRRGLAAPQGIYDCWENSEKAAAIAQQLLHDWEFAKQLTEWHGGRFVGILQPVVYFSGGRGERPLPDIEPSASDEHQYRAIYPRLREEIARGGVYHDLTAALDTRQHLYLDWVHLPPEGNRHIAAEMAAIIARLGVGRGP